MTDFDYWLNEWKNVRQGFDAGVNKRSPCHSYEHQAIHINKYMKFQKTDKILDVGCGNGLMLRELYQYSHDLSGVDYSETMVELAKNLLSVFEGVTVKVAEANKLPFEDNTFDKIICMGVIQYMDLEYATQTVTEFLRVCKEGGLILLGDMIDKNLCKVKASGMNAHEPVELVQKHKYTVYIPFYEAERRFDLVICK